MLFRVPAEADIEIMTNTKKNRTGQDAIVSLDFCNRKFLQSLKYLKVIKTLARIIIDENNHMIIKLPAQLSIGLLVALCSFLIQFLQTTDFVPLVALAAGLYISTENLYYSQAQS